MKINTLNFINNTIRGINKIQEAVDDARSQYEEHDSKEVSVEVCGVLDDIDDALYALSTTDVGFRVLAGHLEKIGELAIKDENKELISILKDIHVLSDEEPQNNPAEQSGTATPSPQHLIGTARP